MKKLILILTSILCMTSCIKEDEFSKQRKEFLGNIEFGLYKGSSALHQYDKLDDNILFDSEGTYFMIYNLTQDEVLDIRFEGTGTDGKISCNISSSGIEDIEQENLTMDVLKNEGGKYWLWSDSKCTGLIVYRNK